MVDQHDGGSDIPHPQHEGTPDAQHNTGSKEAYFSAEADDVEMEQPVNKSPYSPQQQVMGGGGPNPPLQR